MRSDGSQAGVLTLCCYGGAEQETFESLLAQLGQDEDAELLENKRSAGSKPSATAARNKASRERQRRERLNDWSGLPFCLALLLHTELHCASSWC